MPRDPEALATSVVLLVQKALAPVLERLAATEARLATLGDLRDRVVTVEAKAVAPNPPDEAFYELRDRVKAIEALQPMTSEKALLMLKAALDPAVLSITAEIASLRERVAVVEVRPSVPGPQGEPGPPGKDGVDGKDGTAGLTYQGVYQEGKSYDLGDLATWAGATWHCNELTTTKPGEGLKAWTLMVKRGRDGKDGRDAVTVPVVSVGARS
jgi:hypothetical protein